MTKQTKKRTAKKDKQTARHSRCFTRVRTQINFAEQGKTKQSFRDEVDINRIVDQYQRTGNIVHLRHGDPQYGDAPDQTLFDAACVQAEIRSAAELAEHMPEEPSEAPEGDVTPSEEDSEENPLQAPEEPSEAAQDESSGEGQ